MQIIFYTENKPEYFKGKSHDSFPPPPDKCPFHDCTLPVKLKKHGFYKRFFISKSFTGIIYVRRYICPVCGRTVSMLPMFCLKGFQYSGIDILNILYELYQGGISLNKLIHRINSDMPTISRRHINYYRKRIIKNRKLIQYGLNLISPEFILSGIIPENQKWVRDFLEKVHSIHPHAFLVRFSNITGKSFMTSQNMIA